MGVYLPPPNSYLTVQRAASVIRARECASKALCEVLRRQPMSAPKVMFAWRASVGETMARATLVQLDSSGTLNVRADTEHWRRETVRSSGVIKQRLAELLGRGIVKSVVVSRRF